MFDVKDPCAASFASSSRDKEPDPGGVDGGPLGREEDAEEEEGALGGQELKRESTWMSAALVEAAWLTRPSSVATVAVMAVEEELYLRLCFSLAR